jgi:thiamine monophosphate kinase
MSRSSFASAPPSGHLISDGISVSAEELVAAFGVGVRLTDIGQWTTDYGHYLQASTHSLRQWAWPAPTACG